MASKSYRGYFGTFFMGLTLGIVAAPCVGPFILGLFTYVGQKGDPFLGFLLFFTLSIGMGLPISFLAIFSGTLNRLPLSGEWMLWVKKLLGWIMMGMAVYMIIPLFPRDIQVAWLLAGVAVISGIHLGWLDRTGKKGNRGFLYFKRILSILIFGGSILYLISASHVKEGIKWLPYDDGIMARAVKERKPLILDFFAEWCTPCKAMERTVFNDPEVVILSESLMCVRMDLTTKQPFQEEIMNRYQVRGVPTIIFINRKGNEERKLRIESHVDKSEFLNRMKQLLNHN